MTHMWEVDHPYYAEEGNYYSNDYHAEYGSWQEFARERGNDDPDMNLVYRWDWKVSEDAVIEGEGSLFVYYVQQRKARCASAAVSVSYIDEPAVRAWLQDQSMTMTAIWAPLDLSAVT